jgi:hypothetical protein
MNPANMHARGHARNRFRKNLPLQFVLAELAAVGVKPDVLEGRHLKLRWTHEGRAHATIVPRTASDWRAALNAAAFVRRQISGRRP